MKKRLFLGLLIMLLSLSVVIVAAQDEIPRNETLYVAGFQWRVPVTFNPLSANVDWPAPGGNLHELVYDGIARPAPGERPGASRFDDNNVCPPGWHALAGR